MLDNEPVFFTHSHDINSSWLSKAYWDEDTKNLYVKYTNGYIYGYRDVSKAEYDKLVSSPDGSTVYNYDVKRKFGTGEVRGSTLELRPNTNQGKYQVKFSLEATVEFEAAPGDVLAALNTFLGKYKDKENTRVTVRGIKEIV